MAETKTTNKGKPTISNDNHDENVGQRSGANVEKSSDRSQSSNGNTQRREHTEEPNTGMRVGGDGNKIHGDDLEEMLPGSGKDRVRRGAETFDMDGEKVSRVSNSNRRSDKLADEDAAYESDDEREESHRGAETFDIGERIDGQRVRSTRDGGDNDTKGALK